jgi:hypothetical protein
MDGADNGILLELFFIGRNQGGFINDRFGSFNGADVFENTIID